MTHFHSKNVYYIHCTYSNSLKVTALDMFLKTNWVDKPFKRFSSLSLYCGTIYPVSFNMLKGMNVIT